MSRTRTTLKDVAKSVGVHPSTVSRVLNPKTRNMVSDEIVVAVIEAAKRLGYTTNPFAYSLKTNRSYTVGVLIPDLTNPIFPPIIRGVEHSLGRENYTAILADTASRLEEERIILERLKSRAIDGLILATAQRDDDIIRDCHAAGIHLVLVNRTTADMNVSSVINDDENGIRQAVEHVYNLGHRRIAHIAGPQNLSTGYARYHAYLASMQEKGLEVEQDMIVFCDAFSEEEGRRALKILYERNCDFTAIVTGNDLLALGCYDVLDERGINCPRDLSITGYNDMPFVDKFKPPLTTVRIPLYEMGLKAGEVLLRLMLEAESEVETIKLAPELIVRGSTAPL